MNFRIYPFFYAQLRVFFSGTRVIQGYARILFKKQVFIRAQLCYYQGIIF